MLSESSSCAESFARGCFSFLRAEHSDSASHVEGLGSLRMCVNHAVQAAEFYSFVRGQASWVHCSKGASWYCTLHRSCSSEIRQDRQRHRHRQRQRFKAAGSCAGLAEPNASAGLRSPLPEPQPASIQIHFGAPASNTGLGWNGGMEMRWRTFETSGKLQIRR